MCAILKLASASIQYWTNSGPKKKRRCWQGSNLKIAIDAGVSVPLVVFTNCYINFLTEVFHHDKNTNERKYQEFRNPILQFEDQSRSVSCVPFIFTSQKVWNCACAEARNINMNKNWRRFTISLIISVWQLTKYPSSLSDNLFNKINIIKEF